MPPMTRRFRAVLPSAIILVSALLLAHHAAEFLAVLREGAGHAKLTLDFRTYMCGAANLTHPYDICHNDEFVSGFVYPPPSIIYFHALSRLPIDTAFAIHSLTAFVSLAVAAWIVTRMTSASRIASLAALAAALTIAPIGTSFAAGQVNVIVMTTAVVAIYLANSDRPTGAGLAVATGFWLKLYPGVIPVLFLNRKQWPGALAACLISALMGLVALLWASPHLFVQYFLDLLPHAQHYTMPGVANSLAGIAAHVHAGGGPPILHFEPIPAAISLASKALLILGIVAALVHRRWTRGEHPLDSLNLLLVAALVTAPNAWGYHYALAFPLLYSVMARTLDRQPALIPVVLICWLAFVIPGWTDGPGLISGNPLLNVLFRGRYAFAALVLAALILVDGWRYRTSSVSDPTPLTAR